MPSNIYNIFKLVVKIGGVTIPILSKYISDKELNKMVTKKVAKEVTKQMSKRSG